MIYLIWIVTLFFAFALGFLVATCMAEEPSEFSDTNFREIE